MLNFVVYFIKTMVKKLLRLLFTTFIISILISTAATCIFYSVLLKTDDYSHTVQKIASGVFLLNCILLIMSLPVIFLSTPELWNNKPLRVALYFSGSIFFIIAALFERVSQHDKEVYLLNGGVFLVVHTFFYFRETKLRGK
jgi:membrane protein CcdC involved in cytochrome C biogenesis